MLKKHVSVPVLLQNGVKFTECALLHELNELREVSLFILIFVVQDSVL